ncbi:DUF805 domain-containing protein [Weissella cibaria]|jgi:uncharacterized membrane protein YhaH (DUF805 family)|uniref:DUF805 domain-containing protein n=1 Tax=Weissella TaxID=46255 RepID=UPI0002193606|nr:MULTISPECIES: DUF805 domain-containing protein [Weissella]APS26504.1 Inner membrane protein YhaI [Weissella cibaria]APU61901.1 Inner membrane protein YhaI [Weissella cibaria]APU64052.1 Inner membrane protein YhaI [Weissella cibaria]ASS52566.1 Inner membrane protein YhaI [Weissella cibaria]KXU06002.1 hypothetical protein WEIDD23_01265 [Weissella sp. DD23]
MTSYKEFWQNYVNFSGRSTRADYWIPTIINAIIIGVLSAIAGVGAQNNQWLTSPIGIIVVLFGLAIILPDLALIVRRVRDTGVKHLVIWAILAIIFNIVGFIFALIPTDQFKN